MFGWPSDDGKKFKRVDTDGVAFADAGLSERHDDRQLAANNIILARQFVRRFGHLGWGFGPSIGALGLPTCFDHDNSPVSKLVFYDFATAAFPRTNKCFFQEVNMPDDSWNKRNLPIPLERPYEIFIPNVNAIDMDTTGSWPYGRPAESAGERQAVSDGVSVSRGAVAVRGWRSAVGGRQPRPTR